jgi:drug/metabolite transporter (DMT)-like permease
MKKAFLLGVAGSFFFAFTFILNRSMNLSGGSWIFSASLRYVFTLPMLGIIVWKRHGFQNTHGMIRDNPKAWFLWSTVGFGTFYAPICYAGSHGESWLIAASWQITIVMGILMAPLFHKRIPHKNLMAAGVILIGVFLLQWNNLIALRIQNLSLTLIPILAAAVSYPLGNRKMMAVCGDRVSTLERIYGMTICSMPFWGVLLFFGLIQDGLPSVPQVAQSFLIALFSGVIATILFFKATDLVKADQRRLAAVESTQAGEVFFTLLGGILILGDVAPNPVGWVGIALIVLGMVANSLIRGDGAGGKPRPRRRMRTP